MLSQIRPQPITPSNHFSLRSSLALPPPLVKPPRCLIYSPSHLLPIGWISSVGRLVNSLCDGPNKRNATSILERQASPDRLCLSLSHPKRGAWLRQTCCLYRQILFTSAGPPKVLLTCGIGLRLVLLVRHDPSPGECISADWETVLNLDCG